MRLHTTAPWTEFGNPIVDPANLGITPGDSVTIEANDIVLSAGAIGTTRILLNTAAVNPAVAIPLIGRGLVLHVSRPLLGRFEHTINLLEGLDSATFCAAFGVTPGFVYETMGGLPRTVRCWCREMASRSSMSWCISTTMRDSGSC